MTIADCPQCHEQVRVPNGFGDESEVRCPHCLADFSLAEVLRSLPPQLIVISAAAPLPVPAGVDEGSGPSSEAGIQVAATASGDSSEAAPVFDLQQAPSPAKIRPMRSPQRNFSLVREMLKIVGGGVVGLAIGQLILWWLPGQWKRDPFQLGPKVSRYAPLLVPAKFHASSLADPVGNSAGSELVATDRSFALDQPAGMPRVPERPSAEFAPADTDARHLASEPVAGETGQYELADPAAAVSSAAEPSATVQTTEPGSGRPQPTELRPEAVQVRNAPEVTPQDLEEKLGRALSANGAWDRAPAPSPAQRRKLAAELYRSLAGLGEVLTYVNHRHEQVAGSVEKVTELMRSFGRDPAKLALVGKVAASWMNSERPHDGICLYGVATSIATRGQLYATQIRMVSGQTITLLGTVDPAQHFETGDQVFVLGVLLEQPRENLEGYEGTEPLVVLDGLHLGLADKAASGSTSEIR